MIQPVECADPNLYLLLLVDVERPVDSEVVVEERCLAHIGPLLTALRSDCRSAEAGAIQDLMSCQTTGWVAGQDWPDRNTFIRSEVCLVPDAGGDALSLRVCRQ